jgi:hypothetical protein
MARQRLETRHSWALFDVISVYLASTRLTRHMALTVDLESMVEEYIFMEQV